MQKKDREREENEGISVTNEHNKRAAEFAEKVFFFDLVEKKANNDDDDDDDDDGAKEDCAGSCCDDSNWKYLCQSMFEKEMMKKKKYICVAKKIVHGEMKDFWFFSVGLIMD